MSKNLPSIPVNNVDIVDATTSIIDKVNPVAQIFDYLKTSEIEKSRRECIDAQKTIMLKKLENDRIKSEHIISEEYKRHHKFMDVASNAINDALNKDKDDLVLQALDRMLDDLDKSPLDKIKNYYDNRESIEQYYQN